MAVPKSKTSHARKTSRRSAVSKLTPPAFSRCSNCGEYCVPHRVCKSCGYYKGVEVIKMDDEI
jgi:large subunit ribosomal protein L32